jgi:short-subunit dehydrogenase
VAVLVNCAGFLLPLPVLGAPWELLERQMCVNALAPVYLTRLLMPLLLAGPRGGSVVNVSSVAAAIGWPYQGLYSASKAALEGAEALLCHADLVKSSRVRTHLCTVL